MTIRVAAIEVSHWHALHDAAYLRHLVAMPDVQLVGVQDSDPALVARRAAEVGRPPTFTDHRQMLAATRPDFVLALGRHRQMAGIAHDLLDQGYPFLMEKPMGINAAEAAAVADKAARLKRFVAVPLAQRYQPFAMRARELLAAGRFGPLSQMHVRINRPGPGRYPGWDCPWMLDPVRWCGHARPLAARRAAADQCARLRARGASDRPGVRACEVIRRRRAREPGVTPA